MSLKKIYNDIAKQYASANQFGAISESHAWAMKQIKQNIPPDERSYRVLDLGVGDGDFLKQLKNILPHDTHYTGVDISSAMLSIAKQQIPELITIETNAASAHDFIPPHSQDLLVAHFINAYVPTDILFSQAERLTRSNGYFSLITTTYDAFPLAQTYLTNFIEKNTIWSGIVGHYYKSMVKHTPVALNQEVLLNAFHTHHFDIVSHERIKLPIQLNNIDELARFGIEGTWFLNTMSIKLLPTHLLMSRIKSLVQKIFPFPYQDTHIIDIILAKKR